MTKAWEEWLKQADYDMDTAEAMFDTARYFYAVFMAHLAVEKALKGLYQEKLNKIPPKTHNLVVLLNRAGVRPPEGHDLVLARLTEAHVVTRYPDDLETLEKQFQEPDVRKLLNATTEVIHWIKTQL